MVEQQLTLFQPRVLNGVIEKFTTPETLLGLSLMPEVPSPTPTVEYDVIEGSRTMSTPNQPGAAAHVINRLGIRTISTSFIYLRDKKVLDAVTLRWLRQPGTWATPYAEQAVLREFRDLDNRMLRFWEWCVWQMFSGTLIIATSRVTANIDYGIKPTHKPTAAPLWTAPGAKPDENIRTWKRLIARDSQSPADSVYLNETTMGVFYEWAKASGLLSEKQKDEYWETGRLSGPFGLDWIVYDLGYVDDAGNEQTYIPDGYIVMVSKDNEPWQMLTGPSADDDSPEGTIGRFAKTWKTQDPSARQILLEHIRFPALLRPDQVVYARVF